MVALVDHDGVLKERGGIRRRAESRGEIFRDDFPLARVILSCTTEKIRIREHPPERPIDRRWPGLTLMSELAHPTTAELKRFIGFLSGYSKVQELQGKIIPGGDHLRGASIRGW